jgi:hypothetical protein
MADVRRIFIIRWPDDRIRRSSETGTGLPADAATGSAVLEDSVGQRVSAETFRVRDTADNVIGVASRLAGTGGAIADTNRSVSNWLVVIPGRGALFLSQPDAFDTTARQPDALDGMITLSPMQNPAFWSNRKEQRITAATPRYAGRILRGTGELPDCLAASARPGSLTVRVPRAAHRAASFFPP